MKKFLIAEAEKARILGMHYNAMGKTLVNEQKIPDNIWEPYVNSMYKAKPGSFTIQTPPDLLSNESIKNKTYDLAFFVKDSVGNTKQVQYQCIDAEPGVDPTFKAGQIFDTSQNLTDVASKLDASGVPWRQMFSWACKPAMAVLASRQPKPQAQVAAATTTVNAPNPVSDADAAARQKSQAETKAKKEQATIDLKTLMDSPSGFLRTTDGDGYLITDKTTLDTQVKELDRVLTAGGIPTGAGQPTQDLLRNMSNLVKRFPEYGQVLNSHIYNLKQ
jgi:hypothetical protein